MGLAEYLEACEERYSSELHLLGGPFYGPGYHSRVPDGGLMVEAPTRAHPYPK